MPIIKELNFNEDFSQTDQEYAVYRNADKCYMFSDGGDTTIVDIFKDGNAFESSYIGSLSYFMEDDIPRIDLAIVDEKERGKGVMTDLYSFLVDLYGILASDIQMTKSAQRMWKKLSNKYKLTEENLEGDIENGPTRYILRKWYYGIGWL